MISGRVLGLAVLALVVGGAAEARTVRRACVDGDARCDVDASCNGTCEFAFCQVPCLVAPCPEIYDLCDPVRTDARRVEVALPPGRGARREAGYVGRTRYALRCRAPRPGTCKPQITSGCRWDLSEADCAAHDGDYGRHGLLPEPSCLCRTTDGGLPCLRRTQCQGECLAEYPWPTATHCSHHVFEYGCYIQMDDLGRASSTYVCAD